MIINNAIQSIAGAYAVNQPGATARRVQTAPTEKADSYVPSQEGQNFRAMLQELKDTDEVRTNKVEYFEKAVANGTYNVSSYDIAGSIMNLSAGRLSF